jgi:thymidine phosphorylase
MEVTHQLAGAMIYLGKKSNSVDAGIELSKKLIRNGQAWEKFMEIVRAQEGNTDVLLKPEEYPSSEFHADYLSPQTGWIESIDALEVGMTAVHLGAGRFTSEDKIDFKAGIRFHKKVGQQLEKDTPLFTIYTAKKDIMEDTVNRLVNAIKISPNPVSPPKMILQYIDKYNL